MTITPLAVPPNPPNSDAHRGMFFWGGAVGSADPLDTDAEVNALITFCGIVGCDVIYLDIWRYLGGGNWTAARANRMKIVVDGLKRSGLRVLALCGDLGWGTNHSWVMDNIVTALEHYNALCTQASQQFDGLMLDVEYWTDEQTYPAATNCPGLCELVRAIRNRNPSWLVGVFAAFGLAADDRPAITYNGKTQADGFHLMDACGLVADGDYRNTAADNGGQIGIITCHTPWDDYATEEGREFQLYVGVETTNVLPSYITFYGLGKAAMETQLALVSSAFKLTTRSSYVGACVHSYAGWSAMGA